LNKDYSGIKSFDLKEQYREIKEEIESTLKSVLSKGQFILGPEVSSLEQEIADYIGVKHAVGAASGTDALYLALLACGIKKGDEVITTPFSFIATAEVITYCQATPVFVDIDPGTFNIDPDKIEEKITEKTRAIIPVHLYGYPADMDALLMIAEKYQLSVIEDAAQAFGAEYKNKKIGSIGNIGCFSFFPTKNLGGYGDGGMMVTDNPEVAEKLRMLRVHGSKEKYFHSFLGYNSRLDEIQAAILRVKLKRIETWNELRRKKAHLYNELLKGLDIGLPCEEEGYKHVYHQYTVRLKERDQCKDFFQKHNIATTIYYPIPITEQEIYKNMGYSEKNLPHSYQASREVLSLPMYPELADDMIETVSLMTRKFVKEGD